MCSEKKKRKEKKKINKASSTPLRSTGDTYERDDPCTCAGNSAIVLEMHFLGDFSLPLITGELLDLKKKRET